MVYADNTKSHWMGQQCLVNERIEVENLASSVKKLGRKRKQNEPEEVRRLPQEGLASGEPQEDSLSKRGDPEDLWKKQLRGHWGS